MAKTSFNRKIGDFDIAWPGKIARHDIVYKAPPSDPLQYGLPVGNGDIGALLWCDDRRVYIVLNKCDLWDDAAFGEFCNWKRSEEEFSTTLRHACRIVIDFGMPLFDSFYLTDFEARLRLKDGCIEMRLDCPFGKLWLEAFVTYNGSVVCTRVRTDFAEDCGVDVTLERYGSRTFSHWYRFYRRDPMLGLVGTEAWTEQDCLLVKHTLTTGDFVCALRPEGEGLTVARKTSHMAAARADACPREFTLFATVTSPFEDDPSAAYALSVLEQASARGFDALLAESEACWQAFWAKSFIETDDDYLDNLWHLTMYYSNAGQRGRYPGRFINSLWNWNRDVQPWNFYFHWNQQEVYWGLNAAGHHELCDSYLNYRFNAMDVSRADAKRLFGVEDGLFVSDVCERRGYNSDGEKHNHTPVGEVALDFWRQYQYTGDREFLLNKALPYMLGAARFFKTLFVREPDGKYHAKCGLAYEGWELLYDPITELAMAESLFGALLSALEAAGVDDPDAALYRDIRDNIAPIQQVAVDGMTRDNGDGTATLLVGPFKGRQVKCANVLSIGRTGDKNTNADFSELNNQYISQYILRKGEGKTGPLMDGRNILKASQHEYFTPSNVSGELSYFEGSHPQANVAPVYPIASVGLKDKGTPVFDAAVTTALVSREEFRQGHMMGWDPMPIVLARLGLADELDKLIYSYPSEWQYFNNGFGHYDDSMFTDGILPFRRYEITDVDDNDLKIWSEAFSFRHMGLEPLGVFSATMNERLLQSYDGVIRIAPAYGKRSARFKLHAVGGFVVMCEIAEGVPTLVAIRSLRGEKLRMVNPWQTAWCGGAEYVGETIEMDTEAGELYAFTPDGDEDFDFAPETPAANMDYKTRPDRNAMLGLPRSF